MVHQGWNHDSDPAAWTYDTGNLRVAAHKGSNYYWFMPQRLEFGAYNDNYENSVCQVAEFIMYEGMLSPDDRRRVEGHLAQKYGLTAGLPADHPWKTGNPFDLVESVGGENVAVTFYWGDDNASSNAAAWDNRQVISGDMCNFIAVTQTRGFRIDSGHRRR